MKVKSDTNTSSFKEEKSLSDFIHRVGHDVGNPLTSLISLASLLERSGPESNFQLTPEDTNKYLKSIIGDAWRVQALIEKAVIILSERTSSDENITNIGEVVHYSINKLLRKPVYQRFDITFCPPNTSLSVKISHSHLEWLVIELLTNALNHLSLSEIGHDFPIFVKLEKSDNWAVLEIKNSFVSDYEVNLKSLFGAFVKLPESSKGTGLGLTAASVMLSRSNSEIFLELDDKKESFIVTVRLPLALNQS